MKSEKLTINGKSYAVDPFLKDYAVMPRASTYIAFIAINSEEEHLFIQFNNGHCTVYMNVPIDVMNAAKDAPSIGKFYHSNIKGIYNSDHVRVNMIRPWDEIFDEDAEDHSTEPEEIQEDRVWDDDEIDW